MPYLCLISYVVLRLHKTKHGVKIMYNIKTKNKTKKLSLTKLADLAEDSLNRKFPINEMSYKKLYRIGYVFSKIALDLRQTAIEQGICKISAIKEQERKATIAKIKTYEWSK